MSLDLRKAGVVGAIAVLALALGFAPAFAQGTQTGTVSGTVSATDGSMLPGVSVALTSPALQGTRQTTTDSSGAYHFRGLPPGAYKVTFTLSGFGTLDRNVVVALGGNTDAKATMAVATVQESLEVIGREASILSETQVATNFNYEDQIDRLAMNRTLAGIAALAPGLTTNTPNANQITVAGAYAYDNVFLLNGVDINDNLFGSANLLFIEDALQEVSVLTSGISAEYGRFSGGVVNAVTKSGSNTFQGSFRTDINNADWIDESRTEKDAIAAGRGTPHVDKTNLIYTYTLGGPMVKDRLWFFGAYRRETSTEARALSVFNTGYDFGTKNRRYEGKLTGSITQNHRVTVDYIKQTNENSNLATINQTLSIDDQTLVDRQTPADLLVARYDGVLTPNLYAEAQYSRKTFGFRNTGGTDTAFTESPFRALGRVGIAVDSHYHAPYFSSLDPEDRNNRQYAGALSYFLSTGSTGRHDLKFGGEYYTSSRTGGNSQSATGFVFFADPIMVGGLPAKDSSGEIIPNFQPGLSRIINFRSVQGAQINLNTFALYLNDRWQLNPHFTFNVGARWERHSTEATQAGITSITSSALVPRLGATWDVKGDGRWILQGTFAQYAGKASETQFADNTNVGTPSSVTYTYAGPPGSGMSYAPGFNLANYNITAGSFPVANIFLDENLDTPRTREWTLQAGTRLGNKGEVKAVYTNRRTTNILEDFITIDLGKTVVTDGGVNFGTFDNNVIRNTDEPNFRKYQGLQFMVNYRPTNDWYVGGHWTIQLANEGNFEGEAGNQPGNYSIIGDRPEFYSAERHYPTGRFDDYQQHRARVFTTYDLQLGKAGTVTPGATYRYDSALTYSLLTNNVAITPQQLARNPGYARPPTVQTIFYAARGSEEANPSHLFDFSLYYEIPVYKTARPFFKAELRNAFNKQPLILFNRTVNPDPASPRDSLGLPTGYIKASTFGTPQNNYTATEPHVPQPRTLLFAVGFRF
jgi:outer membrane receptor for ferrienterochelin and colicin